MKWESTTPTNPGWYWWRKSAGKAAQIVELVQSEDAYYSGLIRTDVDEHVPNPGTYGGGYWYGPLEEPQENATP